VKETNIAELYERDPLELSDQDLDAIIAYNREKRADFQKKQKAAVQRKSTKNPIGVDVKVNL